MNNATIATVARCQCECNNLVETHLNQLQQGLTISCGCVPVTTLTDGEPLTLSEIVEVLSDKNILELSSAIGISHITLYKITKEYEETGTTTVKQQTLNLLSDYFKREAVKHLNLTKR
jgi:hypothetical protein